MKQLLPHYKYHLRPGYGSTELLIEVFSGVARDDFMADLMDTIRSLQPKLVKQQDLWMNDEILLEMDTDLGAFVISKDIWDLAFIMAGPNEPLLRRINALLEQDERFEKVEVDFERFRH